MYSKKEAKDYIITQEPIFLERARNINGRHSFVCPCCNNGSGRDGTGITMIPRTNEHPQYKCFKCGESGDVIKLAQQLTGEQSFARVMEFLYDEYGLEVEGYDSTNRKPFVRCYPVRAIEDEPERPEVDQTSYFERVEANLDPSYLEERGLSLETQRYYHIGTDKEWINPVVEERYKAKGQEIPSFMKSPRCIIPTSGTSYLARDTRKDVPEANKKYQKVKYGKAHLFAKDDVKTGEIIVVTEGEIDAMSIYEATTGKTKGAGLGSTSNWRKFLNMMVIDGIRPSGVILALDNDDAGKKVEDLMQINLDVLEIPNVVLNFDGKDPNEALQKDRDAFKEAIETAIDELEKNNEFSLE